MSDDRAPSGYQRQQQEAAMKQVVEALLRGIDLRKWCIEQALKCHAIPGSQTETVKETATAIHAFVTADVKVSEAEDES